MTPYWTDLVPNRESWKVCKLETRVFAVFLFSQRWLGSKAHSFLGVDML